MRIGSLTYQPAIRGMSQTTRAIGIALERLSTGKRVNSPKDDAAAYSINVGLESQVRGLRQANLGINSAKSMLEVADSTLSTQVEIVQRMREIALQAASGSLQSADRDRLNSELQSLMEEFGRLGREAEFNGQSLLDGGLSDLEIQLSGLHGDSLGLNLESSLSNDIFTQTVGTGTFTSSSSHQFDGQTRTVKLADVNQDGDLDLIGATSTLGTYGVALGNGDGTFQSERTYYSSGGVSSESVEVVDINGDEILDLVGAGSNGLHALIGRGDGTFEAAHTISSDVMSRVNAADLDNDGDLDLVVTNGGGVWGIMEGRGDGTFNTTRTQYLASGTNITQIGDINGDGNLDILWAGSKLTAFMGTGSISYTTTTPTVILGASVGSALALGDVDGDGDLDFLDAEGDVMRIYRNSGSGVFSSVSTFYSSVAPSSVRFHDLNADGFDDYVATDDTNGYVTLRLSNGDGTFANVKTYAVETGAPSMYLDFGDVNEDGAVDIAYGIRSTGNAGLLFGDEEERSALSKVRVDSQEGARNLLNILDSALSNLSDRRSAISALHNRLDSALSSNLILSENLAEAKSKSEDADIAEETAELVRNQILQQAQVAVFAQANLNAQVVLNLFRDF